MTTVTLYEFISEAIDVHGDIIDIAYCDKYKGLIDLDIDDAVKIDRGVMKNVYINEKLKHRAYAYNVNGVLCGEFDDGSKVPKHIINQINK